MSKSVFLNVLVAASIWSVIGSSPASAQAPAPIWTGFYVGAHGGGGWGSASIDGTPLDFDTNGAVGGLHGGYQHQFGNLVLGIEADASFGKLDDEQVFVERFSFPGFNATATTKFGSEINTLASLKARIGYAAGPLLVFASGGVAWNRMELSFFDSLTVNGQTFVSDDYKEKDTLVGWTVGGGAEYRFMKFASARIEVQHYRFEDDFESDRINIPDFDVETTLVRGGLTFHLN